MRTFLQRTAGATFFQNYTLTASIKKDTLEERNRIRCRTHPSRRGRWHDDFGINGLGKVIKGIPMPKWNPMELAGNKAIAQTALNVLSTSIDVYQEIRRGCPIQNWIDRLPLLK